MDWEDELRAKRHQEEKKEEEQKEKLKQEEKIIKQKEEITTQFWMNLLRANSELPSDLRLPTGIRHGDRQDNTEYIGREGDQVLIRYKFSIKKGYYDPNIIIGGIKGGILEVTDFSRQFTIRPEEYSILVKRKIFGENIYETEIELAAYWYVKGTRESVSINNSRIQIIFKNLCLGNELYEGLV